ncbi:PD-(D/E)XK nuclease family protein [Leptolyngbya sp. FACHB-541]|uniref:PD-(D/E)XK nuclease family protein n=1 Tax=Leptolyngbya sp. FACHB-541 TaxID=2692810 RepID=UPI0016887BD6|nr:PD-(D/E)XK nuclease family protein [Leptolyngbya sp. FACHB-541]MBD2000437.1 PD-(D/E)XK nuclease family protein [Leptolyngbya sp. FACHB-541]
MLQLKNKDSDRTPLEDFFTEIFAFLLKTRTSILVDLLNQFTISSIKQPDFIYLSTQESFDTLANHAHASRPDVFIEVASGDQRDIIFIESKIGSAEGWEQLKRYAEHLNHLHNINNGILLFITRDYEPKNQDEILKICDRTKIKFLQLRWHEIYHFLSKYQEDFLLKEIKSFMEINNMSQSGQFSAIDILALTNFSNARSIMDETLLGEVAEVFRSVCGSMSEIGTASTQLRQHNRYIISSDRRGDIWVGLGYWMNPSVTTNYPEVGILIEAIPNATDREQILKAMLEIVQSSSGKWRGNNLAQVKSWASIMQVKPLHTFISGEDHVASVRTYFKETLADVYRIRQEYVHLPWKF